MIGKKEPRVERPGYIIADEDGRAQMHTFRSNARESWQALYQRPITNKERERLKRMGFCVVYVWIQNFREPRTA